MKTVIVVVLISVFERYNSVLLIYYFYCCYYYSYILKLSLFFVLVDIFVFALGCWESNISLAFSFALKSEPLRLNCLSWNERFDGVDFKSFVYLLEVHLGFGFECFRDSKRAVYSCSIYGGVHSGLHFVSYKYCLIYQNRAVSPRYFRLRYGAPRIAVALACVLAAAERFRSWYLPENAKSCGHEMKYFRCRVLIGWLFNWFPIISLILQSRSWLQEGNKLLEGWNLENIQSIRSFRAT